MVEYTSVNITIPVLLKKRIEQIAEKRMSNFSQVIREAAGIGLKTME